MSPLGDMDIYLDTNAVGNFDERDGSDSLRLAAARKRLEDLVRSGDVSVFLSMVLLEELLGILRFDPQKYTRLMRFLWGVGRSNLLLTTPELGRAEASAGRRLDLYERLYPWLHVSAVRYACQRDQALVRIPALTQHAFAEFERKQIERRDRSREKIKSRDKRPVDATRAWWSEAEAHIDDWVVDFMERQREQLGLSEARSVWPRPRDIQSAWLFHAYLMARVHMNVGENRRIEGSDKYDAHHYVAAAYCDVMVSDDKGLRDTWATIPVKPFALETFDEFVASRLQL